MNIPFHTQFIHDDRFHPNDVLEQAATAMLYELLRLGGALRPLGTRSLDRPRSPPPRRRPGSRRGPPGAVVNPAANRELWNDRGRGSPPGRRPRYLPGDDDLRQRRPTPLDGERLAALPDASQTVLNDTVHAP